MEQKYNHVRGRFAPQYDHDLVMRTIEECGTQLGAARKLGMLQSTVNRIARSRGVVVGRGGRPRVHDLDMEAVIARYQSGETCEEIAASLSLLRTYIERRLAQAGVERRRRGPRRAETNFQWKGGRKRPMNYWRRQSYEVTAICLGRPLPKGWVIHHLDENPENNDPTNLSIFVSQSLHASHHQRLLALQREGIEVDATREALASGARLLPPPPAPIQFGPYTGPLFPSDTPE